MEQQWAMDGQGVRRQEAPKYGPHVGPPHDKSKDFPYSRGLGLRPKASPSLRTGISQPSGKMRFHLILNAHSRPCHTLDNQHVETEQSLVGIFLRRLSGVVSRVSYVEHGAIALLVDTTFAAAMIALVTCAAVMTLGSFSALN